MQQAIDAREITNGYGQPEDPEKETPAEPVDSYAESTTTGLPPCVGCGGLKNPELMSSTTRCEKTKQLSELVVQLIDPEYCESCHSLRGQLNGFERPSRLTWYGSSEAEAEELLFRSTFEMRRDSIMSNLKLEFDNGAQKFKENYILWWERGRFLNMKSLRFSACIVPPQPDYAAVSAWLKHCSENHTHCQALSSNALRSIYLIDVTIRSLVPYPTTDVCCDYCALSYVWGGVQQQAIGLGPLPTLPQVIEDSMIVVKSLGKQFLWVDSICIDQSDAEEKRRQIATMHSIFECAFATIIALGGESANDGLHGVSVPRDRQLVAYFDTIRFADELPSLETPLRSSKWATRAWTLQEDCLSRRRLFFAPHQLYFECNEMECCESTRSSRKVSRPKEVSSHHINEPLGVADSLTEYNYTGPDIKSAYESFVNVLNSYVRRALSNDGDSLIAFEGMLRHLETARFPEGFFYGLALKDFRRSILWRQSFERDSFKHTERRANPETPSWSWAAWRLLRLIQIPGYDIGIDVSPPLTVTTSRGQKVSVDSDPKAWCLGFGMFRYIGPEGAGRFLGKLSAPATKEFYSSLDSREVEDKTLKVYADVRDIHLKVQGIILSLDCFVRVEQDGNRPYVHVLFPEEFRYKMDLMGIPMPTVEWKNECHIAEIVPVGSWLGPPGTDEVDPDPTFEQVHRQEFLVVCVTHTELLSVECLHLCWRQGFATRLGVVCVSAWPGFDVFKSEVVTRAFWKSCNPRICRFWLG